MERVTHFSRWFDPCDHHPGRAGQEVELSDLVKPARRNPQEWTSVGRREAVPEAAEERSWGAFGRERFFPVSGPAWKKRTVAEPGRHVRTHGGDRHKHQEDHDPVLPEQGDHRQEQELCQNRDPLSHEEPGTGRHQFQRDKGSPCDDRREEKREETGVINVKDVSSDKGPEGHEVGRAERDADRSVARNTPGRVGKQ